MRPRLCCVALAIVLVPLAAAAQDGLRSGSLPERPLRSSAGPLREDGYRARPDTYRPDPHRVLVPGFDYFAPQFLSPYNQPIIVVHIPRDVVEPARVAPAPPAPVQPTTPYVAGVPGRPKTFYVIPGCYAGDRRPEPESLARGCNIARLRVVPPRP